MLSATCWLNGDFCCAAPGLTALKTGVFAGVGAESADPLPFLMSIKYYNKKNGKPRSAVGSQRAHTSAPPTRRRPPPLPPPTRPWRRTLLGGAGAKWKKERKGKRRLFVGARFERQPIDCSSKSVCTPSRHEGRHLKVQQYDHVIQGRKVREKGGNYERKIAIVAASLVVGHSLRRK